MIDDALKLIDKAIRYQVNSIGALLDAKEALVTEPEPPDVIHVGPGQSLLSALESAPSGATIIVDPSVKTVSDITFIKPVSLQGANITGFLFMQAPDVGLQNCDIQGPHESGTVITTGERTVIQACKVRGSTNGQHRGICVNSADVHIVDTQITGIYKAGQEAQAIGGWDGTKRLTVDNCLLEAAGENFMLGGSDCGQDKIPEDVVIRNCTMTKPTSWRGKGYAVKNLFEVKNVRKLLMENCTLEYSWVEGQTGFAIVITPRNQDGSAPWSTVEDVTIRGCTIRHMAGGIQSLGTDYSHPSDVLKRLTVENCIFEDISPAWGANQRCLQQSQGGEDIVYRNNRFSGSEINSFMTFEGTPMVRYVVEGNTFPEGYYGIKADDTVIGTPTLEKYAPGYTWNNNTVIRTVPSNYYQYPAGTNLVMQGRK